MSYKAAKAVKEHLEIGMIKAMSPEEINAMLNKLHDENKQLNSGLEQAQQRISELKDEVSMSEHYYDELMSIVLTHVHHLVDSEIDHGDINQALKKLANNEPNAAV